MSSENGFMGDLLGKVRESASHRVGDAFADGYSEAANICIGVLSRKIDDLLNQIKSGRYLSDQEQFLLSSLDGVKSDTESTLRDFWNSTGGE